MPGFVIVTDFGSRCLRSTVSSFAASTRVTGPTSRVPKSRGPPFVAASTVAATSSSRPRSAGRASNDLPVTASRTGPAVRGTR
jgi:hypothetical protein